MKNNTKLNILVIIAIVVLLFVSSSASSLSVQPVTDDFSNSRLTSQDFPSHGNSTSTSSNTSNEETPARVMPLSIPKITGSSFSLEGYSYSDPWYSSYTEPSPMGIGFIGLEPNGQVGPEAHEYNYSTPSFLGIAKVYNLTTHNSKLGQFANFMTFQFNIILGFNNGGTLYNYWIQDVALVNTSANTAEFSDEVWNFTYNGSVLGELHSHSIIGNGGSLPFYSSSYYTYTPPVGPLGGMNDAAPGNEVPLSLPYTLEFKVNATINDQGYPDVEVYYNDGYGWVEYDSISFIFAKNLEGSPEFTIGGSIRTNGGKGSSSLLYDAGLILGGPGGGSNTYLESSNITLELEYWNGHNYQAPSFAYNFAPDTAEGINNAMSEEASYDGNSSLAARITSQPGEPGLLYNFSNVSTLEINSGLSSGRLQVNQTSYPFLNSSVNVTLVPNYPNYYNVTLYNSQGQLVWENQISLIPGKFHYLSLNIPSKNITRLTNYAINFEEMGLSTYTIWAVTLSGTTFNDQNVKFTILSISSNISFEEQNGTYYYSIQDAFYFTSTPSSGYVNLTGSNSSEVIKFEKLYPVTLTVTGLPPGRDWNVNISGSIYGGILTRGIFYKVNGTYSYTTLGVNNGLSVPYLSYPYSGSFTVNGAPASLNLTFFRGYYVNFVTSGLTINSKWWVTITNKTCGVNETQNSTMFTESAELSVALLNGTYSYSVNTDNAEFRASPVSGTFTINGTNITKYVNFRLGTYLISFTESGLPSGSTWSVTLNASTKYSTSNEISFSEPNGNYFFSVGAVGDYSSSPNSGSVVVNGTSVAETITFTQPRYLVTFSETGLYLPYGSGWWINITGQSSSDKITETAYSVYLTNGSYYYTIGYTVTSPTSGYLVTNPSHIIVDGSSIKQTINFTPLYSIMFSETGLPPGTEWSITINGTTIASNDSITFNEPNSTFAVTISNIRGYVISGYSGGNPVIIKGERTTVFVTWTATYPITIIATGIPIGVAWSSTLVGTTFFGQKINETLFTTSGFVTFREPNGSYSYVIHIPSGYTGINQSGSFKSTGKPVTINIATHKATHYTLIIIVALMVVIAVLATIVAMMRRGKR